MKDNNIRGYRKHAFSSDFHIHTNHVHGANSIEECVSAAKKNGLHVIGIVEHTRRRPTYDFNQLYQEVMKERQRNEDVEVLLGLEAKVLNREAELDIKDELIKDERVDFIIGVFHSWPLGNLPNSRDYVEMLENMLKRRIIDVWGHPFLLAETYGFQFDDSEILEITELVIKCETIVELNLRYGLPPVKFLNHVLEESIPFVIGSDAHAKDEIWNTNRPDFVPPEIWQEMKEIKT